MKHKAAGGGKDHPLRLFSLENRVAFLSGAAGHLGPSMARGLCAAGAHVILNGRRPEPLRRLAKELTSKGYRATTACFDITNEKRVAEYFRKFSAEHKKLDIIVNNAYAGAAGTSRSATPDDFMEAYRVSVVAAHQIVKAALPLLKKAGQANSGGASVINIASMYGSVSPDPSVYGRSGKNNPPFYGSAKAGLIQLTRYEACHLAPENIRVNCISPGPFPAFDPSKEGAAFQKKLSQKNPMRRMGRPEELAGAILFLASDAASYVTGANIAVDGGWTAW